jgi:hypothetical protein
LKIITDLQEVINMKTAEKTKSDEIKLQTDIVSDLPVADKQADATKGGPGSRTSDLADWQSNYGVSI